MNVDRNPQSNPTEQKRRERVDRGRRVRQDIYDTQFSKPDDDSDSYHSLTRQEFDSKIINTKL